MSFLRIATLFAAIASFLVFALSLTTLILDLIRDPAFLYGTGNLRLAGIFAWLIFYLALTVFFTALFARPKE
jgi:hypothetical protein